MRLLLWLFLSLINICLCPTILLSWGGGDFEACFWGTAWWWMNLWEQRFISFTLLLAFHLSPSYWSTYIIEVKFFQRYRKKAYDLEKSQIWKSACCFSAVLCWASTNSLRHFYHRKLSLCAFPCKWKVKTHCKVSATLKMSSTAPVWQWQCERGRYQSNNFEHEIIE